MAAESMDSLLMGKRVLLLVLMSTGSCVVCLCLYGWTRYLSSQSQGEILYQGIGLALSGYAANHDGNFPAVPIDSCCLMFDFAELAPAYIHEYYLRSTETQQEKDHEEVSDNCRKNEYFYLGYVVFNEHEAESLAQIYERRLVISSVWGRDIHVEAGKGNLGGDKIYSLRNNVADEILGSSADELAKAKLKSQIPIMIQRILEKSPSKMKALVLFLDNHVEELEYPGNFPMSRSFQKILWAMEDAGK